MFAAYTQAPYADHVIAVPPRQTVAPQDARPFDCRPSNIRDPRETKGQAFAQTQLPIAPCCGPGECP
jgi:hypothetical protein